jgi:hypothetical protein
VVVKKLIAMISIVFGLVGGLQAKVDGGLSDSQVEAVQKLIQLYGHKCDYVNFAIRSNWSGNISVSCNENRYSYTLKDKGGHWIVEVR